MARVATTKPEHNGRASLAFQGGHFHSHELIWGVGRIPTNCVTRHFPVACPPPRLPHTTTRLLCGMGSV